MFGPPPEHVFTVPFFQFLTASYFMIWFARSASFSRILEILEIEVCNILQNPRDIGNRIFSISHILETLEN